MNMIQVLKRIANTSVNTFSLAIMSIRPLFEEIWTGNAICRTNVVPRQERVNHHVQICRRPLSALFSQYLAVFIGSKGGSLLLSTSATGEATHWRYTA
jgi:hypothetical protein